MIILHANGQTCNKLFTYSNYIADSLETDETIVILSPDIITKDFPYFENLRILKFPFYFRHIANIAGYKTYIKLLEVIWRNKYTLKLLSILFTLIPSINFVIAPTGSYKSIYTNKYTTELKKIFSPKPQIVKKVKLHFETIRVKYNIICGVHIRHGDYKKWNEGKYFYSELQFLSVMMAVKNLFPNQLITFFISSNEKIDFTVFKDIDFFYIPNGNKITDLYGLSISDYIIGPPSTFSGWASHYGNTPLYFIENLEKKITLSSFKTIAEIWD